jgi:hypothetical protein
LSYFCPSIDTNYFKSFFHKLPLFLQTLIEAKYIVIQEKPKKIPELSDCKIKEIKFYKITAAKKPLSSSLFPYN